MSKVIRFSRQFPSYHPRKGEPTYFVEMILNWYWETQNPQFHNVEDMIFLLNPDKDADLLKNFVASLNPDIKAWKSHTIRQGERFKAGDMASLRVWSGRPYHTTDIVITPEVKIPKVWEFSRKEHAFYMEYKNEKKEIPELIHPFILIANNDGLFPDDMISWFNKPFDGQIICWNELIEY